MIHFIEKYKPKNLDSFIMNDETKDVLRLFISIDKLNILVIGDSGSGKSTLLDVIMNTYYNDIDLSREKKCNKDDYIMYINILKEQGIHTFRQNIKTFCQTTNNLQKYKKTIVIDNIDQINEQTQQIIRNNIDKYSHKVNFIMSCSNIQKVVDTIQSRVNIIKLDYIPNTRLFTYCKEVITKEEFLLNDECITYLVNISNNSLRLLLLYLTKLSLLPKPYTIELIKEVCTQISYTIFEEYTDLLLNQRDLNKAIDKINILIERGFSVMDILESYFYYIKSISQINDTIKYKIYPSICKYINIFHSIHESTFELTLFTFELYNTFN